MMFWIFKYTIYFFFFQKQIHSHYEIWDKSLSSLGLQGYSRERELRVVVSFSKDDNLDLFCVLLKLFLKSLSNWVGSSMEKREKRNLNSMLYYEIVRRNIYNYPGQDAREEQRAHGTLQYYSGVLLYYLVEMCDVPSCMLVVWGERDWYIHR